MKWIVVAAALAFAGGAQAQGVRTSNLTGGKLGNACTSKAASTLEACNAYLEGVSDTLAFYQFLQPADGSKGGKLPAYICIPNATTGPQLRETYVSWLRQHGDGQRQTASEAVMRAYKDSYPCKDEQKKP